jgi:GDP-4-dehydro-6-deoxy-D-mannose reductase
LGGTLNLLEAVKASGVGARVVLVSSGICYGDPAPEFIPIREDCPMRPNNPYAASKAAADLLGIQHHLADRTDVVMVRPFNHAGPRQSARYVLAALAQQVAEVEAGRRPLIEVGNLEVVRDFTDVRDVVRAYRLLATGGGSGEIYNLGTGQGTRIAGALDHLRSLARTPVEVRVDPARVRPVDLPFLVADATKLRNAVGWRPRFSIEQTLADMLDTFRTTLDNQGQEPR